MASATGSEHMSIFISADAHVSACDFCRRVSEEAAAADRAPPPPPPGRDPHAPSAAPAAPPTDGGSIPDAWLSGTSRSLVVVVVVVPRWLPPVPRSNEAAATCASSAAPALKPRSALCPMMSSSPSSLVNGRLASATCVSNTWFFAASRSGTQCTRTPRSIAANRASVRSTGARVKPFTPSVLCSRRSRRRQYDSRPSTRMASVSRGIEARAERIRASKPSGGGGSVFAFDAPVNPASKSATHMSAKRSPVRCTSVYRAGRVETPLGGFDSS